MNPDPALSNLDRPDLSRPVEADRLLSQYRWGCPNPSPIESEAIRTALASLAAQASYLTLGICAETATEAIAALNQYLAALNSDLAIEAAGLPAVGGAVYVKFNTRSQQLYGDRYGGSDRGVLVSTQGDYDGQICGTYGHFPLDLFA